MKREELESLMQLQLDGSKVESVLLENHQATHDSRSNDALKQFQIAELDAVKVSPEKPLSDLSSLSRLNPRRS